MGDKDIPYRLLRKIMFTGARAGFADVSFAVRQRFDHEGGRMSEPAECPCTAAARTAATASRASAAASRSARRSCRGPSSSDDEARFRRIAERVLLHRAR